MKIHYVAMIAVALAVLFLSLCLLQSRKTAQYENASTGYAEKLQSACFDAAKTINMTSLRDGKGVWDSFLARDLTLDIFYRSLALNLNREDASRNEIAEMTPIVVLADNGGFYINYSACFDPFDNIKISDTADGRSVTSAMNTYAESFGNIAVHFYLSDYVEVILSDGSYICGTRQEVYDDLPVEARNTLSFMSSEFLFDENRAETIASSIEEALNYYLNTQFVNEDAYNTGYQISIPRTSGETWARSIENPTIIAFLQGEQDYLEGRLLSTYAYAAGEMSVGDLFFIQDGLYYRVDGSIDIQKVLENGIYRYFYNGVQIDQFYTSMQECAATGAVPAEQIFLH